MQKIHVLSNNTMKRFLAILLVFICFAFSGHFFGSETITVYLNKKKIGHWSPTQKTCEKLMISFNHPTDTLCFSGWSDCGALDGTVIKIKYKDSVIVQLTRVSGSGILRHDTLMTSTPSGKKQSFVLDHDVIFHATPTILKKLQQHAVYSVFIQRIIDKHASETPIFDLQLN